MRNPARAFGSRYGALVIDSMPPATMTSALPVARMSCASMAAFIPEPHILFTVVQPALSGNPAPSEAWRAGAWPWPAASTHPMITSCTSSAPILARSTAARIAAAPSSGAAKFLSSPWNAPIGVRAAETMTIGSDCMLTPSLSTPRRAARQWFPAPTSELVLRRASVARAARPVPTTGQRSRTCRP